MEGGWRVRILRRCWGLREALIKTHGNCIVPETSCISKLQRADGAAGEHWSIDWAETAQS
eukprot:1103594-Rhodomonas_salina.1